MSHPQWSDDERARPIVQSVCIEHEVDVDLLRDLCQLYEEYAGSGRPHGIRSDIQARIDSFISRHSSPVRG